MPRLAAQNIRRAPPTASLYGPELNQLAGLLALVALRGLETEVAEGAHPLLETVGFDTTRHPRRTR
jgi:hypothetical protein